MKMKTPSKIRFITANLPTETPFSIERRAAGARYSSPRAFWYYGSAFRTSGI
jgi:hypothetical protein